MRKPSHSEPVSELRFVPIVENGEPLVDFLKHCPKLVLDRPRFNYTRATVVRASVADMLCAASERIPSGYKLAVIEGWRAPHIQRRMYLAVWKRFKERNPHWSEAQLKRVVNRFTAPIQYPRVPPPHSTGGAVDVTLVDEAGNWLDMSSPYEVHDPKSYPLGAPGLSDTARRHRDILASALTGTGLTNYPSEYWHWTYGDQGWAYRGGHPHAIYGAVTPEGFTPDPSEAVEEPLIFQF